MSYRLEDQAGLLIRKAHQRASEIFAVVMAEFDLTPTQFSALVTLMDGPLAHNQLGRLIAIDPATLSGVVRRLVTRGLVLKRRAADDARLSVLVLSDDGLTLATAAKARGPEVTARILAPLTREDAESLTRLLKRLG